MNSKPPSTGAAPEPARCWRPWVSAVLLAGLGSCLVQVAVEGPWLRHPDAKLYAYTARELVREGRFADRVLLPAQLAGIGQVDPQQPWPMRIAGPGYPLLVSLAQRVLGVSDRASIALSVLGFLAALGAVMVVARRLAGEAAAVAAGGLMVAHNHLASRAIAGEVEAVYAALTVGALGLSLAGGRARRAAGAGLLLGLAWIIRPTAVMFLPAVLALWWLGAERRGRARGAGAMLAALAVVLIAGAGLERLVAAPPLQAGAPVSSYAAQILLYGTRSFPGHEVFRGEHLLQLSDLGAHLGEVAEKIVRNLRASYQDAPYYLGAWVLALGLLGAVLTPVSGRVRGYAWVAVYLWLAHVLMISATAFDGMHRYLTPVTVAWLPLAGAGLVGLHRWTRGAASPRQAGLVVALVVGIALYPRLVDVYEQWRIPDLPEEKLLAERVAERVAPGEIVMNDEADREIAWWGDRRVVRLPETVAAARRIYEQVLPVGLIVVSAEPRFFEAPEGDPVTWFPGFRLDERLVLPGALEGRTWLLYRPAEQP